MIYYILRLAYASAESSQCAQGYGCGIAPESIDIFCWRGSGITNHGVDARLPSDKDGQSLAALLLNRIIKHLLLFDF